MSLMEDVEKIRKYIDEGKYEEARSTSVDLISRMLAWKRESTVEFIAAEYALPMDVLLAAASELKNEGRIDIRASLPYDP